MFKNKAIKKMIKGTISPFLSVVNKCICKRDDIILLYSANRGIGSNLKPILEYLLNDAYYEKYKIICSIEKMEYAGSHKEEVRYVNHIKGVLYFFITKHVFYTTGMIPIKPSKKQIVIQLDHGTAFKAVNAMSKINNGYEFYFTYYTAASKAFIPSVCKRYGCKVENVAINGEPIIDKMLKSKVKYNLGSFSKVLLWAPTYRQSDYYGYSDSTESLLPMFEDNDYDELNGMLQQYNFRLIVKLHPGQDTSMLQKTQFSNLNIYSSQDFEKEGWDLYDLLPQIDFLLADYSSVFLQFLLLNKPMAFVVPDFEEYMDKRGFNFENPLELMPGKIIRTPTALYTLFEEINKNIDIYKDRRKQVRDIIHTYSDGRNTQRAIELSQISK